MVEEQDESLSHSSHRPTDVTAPSNREKLLPSERHGPNHVHHRMQQRAQLTTSFNGSQSCFHLWVLDSKLPLRA